jgi:hypothetical protein
MYYIIGMRKERIFSLRLTAAMREALGKAANRERRSVASLLEKIIADYLSKEGIRWEKAPLHDERRQYPRKGVSLPARMTILESQEICEETEALVENMSMGGAYVSYTNGHRSPWKLASGIHLVVRIPRSSDPMEIGCRAVRVMRDEHKVGVGLQYVDPSPENLDLIHRFLQNRPP